jgi:hypothetical protein
MRTKPFTFKKTIKRVEVHPGLEINVTLQEAADLREVIGNIACDDPAVREKFIFPLYEALTVFVLEHGGMGPRAWMTPAYLRKAA